MAAKNGRCGTPRYDYTFAPKASSRQPLHSLTTASCPQDGSGPETGFGEVGFSSSIAQLTLSGVYKDLFLPSQCKPLVISQ
jgi:hypothetical protein